MQAIQLGNPNQCQFKCYAVDDDTVLIDVTPPNEVYLSGIVNVKVIYGVVDLMGYKLTPVKSPVTVYSVKEYCLLKIISRKNETREPINESYLSSFNIDSNISRLVLSEFSTASQLIWISKHKELGNIMQFVHKYQLPVFVGDDFNKPLSELFPVETRECHCYQEGRKWNATTELILSKKSPKTILSGGKDAGKSTLLGYLVNKSLNTWDEVLVIDFDPSQSEFTIPGCLSATIIRSPLLGPNFSRSSVPAKCLYLGFLDVTDSQEQYIRCIKNLMDYCYAHFDTGIPWFVNTMGFIEGAGVTLLLHIIESVNPTDVIVIKTGKEKNCNLYRKLAAKQRDSNPTYYLHSFPSFSQSIRTINNVSVRSVNASNRRNIAILFYFLRAMKNVSVPTFLAIVPHSLSLENVKIIVEKPSSGEIQIFLNKFQSLCSINVKMVALCTADSMDNILQCIGHGIVRGFDSTSDELYIITPVDSEHLSKVEVIHSNSVIQLPETVYRTGASFSDGPVPYLTFKRADRFNEKTKKSSSRLKYRPSRQHL